MDPITSKKKMEAEGNLARKRILKKKTLKKKMEVEENLPGEKKAVLIGLKHPRTKTDIKGLILRMKKQLMDLREFFEDNITFLIEDEPDCFQPTKSNIDTALNALVCHANRNDILFVYLLAHGCKPGMVVTSDKQSLSDYFFGKLLGNRHCTITFVSDCQIEPAGKAICCSFSTKTFRRNYQTESASTKTFRSDYQTEGDWESSSDGETYGYSAEGPQGELVRKILKHNPRFLRAVVCKCYDSHSGNLSHVDILKDEKNEDVNKVTTISDVPTETAEGSLHQKRGNLRQWWLQEMLKSLNLSRPHRGTLFTAFECDPNLKGETMGDTPKLFFPRPSEVACSGTPSVEHTVYGSFTNVMLDIIEETQGRVTNLELAQKATEKLKIQGNHQKVGLDCSELHDAYDSFVC